MNTEAAPPTHSIAAFLRGYSEERRLLGLRSECGFVSATWGLLCPQCGKRDLREVTLSGHGRIAAFSVQTVPAEEFVNDAPYAYIVVELEEGGRVTGWIPGVRTEEELRIGERVRWVSSYRPGVQFERERSAPEGTG
ncbi:MAG: OB-fold domain-containing protein [Thermoplasmata archaeon]|nr:OB-fold domain-containing protein [Thermoplasmata archaeon]